MVFKQNKAEVTQTRRKSKYKILGWKEIKRTIFFFFQDFFLKLTLQWKIFLEKILFIFRDRKREGEREKERIINMWEKHRWVASHMPPNRTWPALTHVPWLGIEPATFHFAGWYPTNWAMPARATMKILGFYNAAIRFSVTY